MAMPIRRQRVAAVDRLDLSPGAVLPCDDHEGQVLLTIRGTNRNPRDPSLWVYGSDERGQARVVEICEGDPVGDVARRAM